MTPLKKNMKTNKMSFVEARKFVRGLCLKTCKEWLKYSQTSSFDKRLPKAPDYFYEDWTNWYDFLGRDADLRKYKVNDNYFKTWSHNMAYILGFWFADGCIMKGNIFSIKQHINDKYLMKSILFDMGSDYPIHEDNRSCLFKINSKTIYNDIIRLGGKERKSLDCRFPNIPEKFLPDFIRGLWDGDGTVGFSGKSKRGQDTGGKASLCSGSKDFIFAVKRILELNIADFKGSVYENHVKKGSFIFTRKLGKNSTIYYLLLNLNNARRLRNFMYSTPSKLRLIRKYDKFMAMGDICQHSKDITYLTFTDAKELLATKEFRSVYEYHAWLQSKDCHVTLPASPDVVYKEEWKGWSDFLGHYRLSYNKLSDMVIRDGVKNRKQYHRWVVKNRGNSRGKFPRHPEMVYKEWQSWDKFLRNTQIPKILYNTSV